MFWSKLCKSSWNCAWNLAFPVFISPIVWNMCENLPYESVYFKELHNEQECYWPTIYRAGAAVVSTITSNVFILAILLELIFFELDIQNKRYRFCDSWITSYPYPHHTFYPACFNTNSFRFRFLCHFAVCRRQIFWRDDK